MQSRTITGETSDFGAESTSGAGGGKVGMPACRAINVASTTHEALVEGDADGQQRHGRTPGGRRRRMQVPVGNETASTSRAVRGPADVAVAGGRRRSVVNVAAHKTRRDR